MNERISAEEVYTEEVGALYDEAAISGGPVSRELLLELAAEHGARPDTLVLDIGCANGGLSRQLIARTGCRVEGVEMLPFLVEMGTEQNAELGVSERFTIRKGSMTEIPFPDEHFDFIFCSDVVGMVEDVALGLDECRRVLKSGGRMLVYATSFGTERLSTAEARELNDALGNAREGTSLERVEAPMRERFHILHKRVIGSEFGQYAIEAGGAASEAAENLLKVARLLTWPERYIAKYGERRYRTVLAEAQWSPFILLGKLAPTVFIVEKPSPGEPSLVDE